MLDLSSTLGVYGMYAVRAGARLVLRIDRCAAHRKTAEKVVGRNGYAGHFMFFHGDPGDVDLPVDKVSEQFIISYCCIFNRFS